MMFQLLKWRWIAGASDSASGRRIKRDVWMTGVFMMLECIAQSTTPRRRA
jgi:hypothetical protein